MTDMELIAKAKGMLPLAYAPYSGYPVGAALLGSNGKVYTGCNIESASYGATICAERAAVAAALGDGCKSFEAIAVISGGEAYCTPCGICRQVLNEFSKDMRVLCANAAGEYREVLLSSLLPMAFGPENM